MTESEYLAVADALQVVLKGMPVLAAERVSLLDGLGRVLAEPVVAGDSLPPFANSSMDGYAVQAGDLVGASKESPARLQVIGEVAAGDVPRMTLTSGTAVRIMTGAPLPAGAEAVVPVEETSEPWRDAERPLPDHIQIFASVEAGAYVRPAGEDVHAGHEVLSAGQVIRPQEIGLLAALGMAEVVVVRQPRVAVLSTGDELIEIEEPLSPGKIRNSNSYALAAQVIEAGATPVQLGVARDSEADVRRKLEEGLAAGVDLFVSSAGVSVGAYDVVKAVLEDGGDVRFWRVRMRPGKPLAYGRYGGVPYLGLPGNPVSATVSFERFVRPAIRKMAGHRQWERPSVTAIVQTPIESDGRESYIRATVERRDGRYLATPTGAQGSNIMTSLVKANALVIVPEGVRQVSTGTALQALMLDWPESVF